MLIDVSLVIMVAILTYNVHGMSLHEANPIKVLAVTKPTIDL